ATEFNKIFDELDNAYAKCFADNQSLYAMNKRNIAKNKCLQIQKNLLIHDESLIANCIAKDVCSIVLASEREVFPRSNCRCKELQSTCDREHSRKQFVDLQVKFQNDKECLRNQKVCEQPNATASNVIFEINKLKAQLQEKDDTIRHLHAEKDILGTPTKPKVLASGMYTKSSKYIPPQKRADWAQPTLLPKKKQVTFLEPHRTSSRSIHKPPVQHKKPTVHVNMFPKAKPATEARKPIPKRNTQNHNHLPAKSVKARRAVDYYRNLYVDI
nr:hypothetical protein [Tanacetum cinerariifolium]